MVKTQAKKLPEEHPAISASMHMDFPEKIQCILS